MKSRIRIGQYSYFQINLILVRSGVWKSGSCEMIHVTLVRSSRSHKLVEIFGPMITYLKSKNIHFSGQKIFSHWFVIFIFIIIVCDWGFVNFTYVRLEHFFYKRLIRFQRVFEVFTIGLIFITSVQLPSEISSYLRRFLNV